MNNYKAKSKQLGRTYHSSQTRLRTLLLFDLLKRHKENICYRCNKEILTVEELTIDHKIDWFRADTKLYWDLKNIAFSHLLCNAKAGANKAILTCQEK